MAQLVGNHRNRPTGVRFKMGALFCVPGRLKSGASGLRPADGLRRPGRRRATVGAKRLQSLSSLGQRTIRQIAPKLKRTHQLATLLFRVYNLTMNHRIAFLAWLFLGGLNAVSLALLNPANVQATPFASPTPASPTINQPYVTFQQERAWSQMFRFDRGIPVVLVILILVILLGLAALSLTSFRPKH